MPVAVAVGVGVLVGVAVGVGDCVGRPLGSGVAPSSAEHSAPSIRQPVGFPEPVTTKPTVAVSPAASPSLSQDGGFTVTCCPLTVDVPFHSELSFAPAGRSNRSVQSSLVRSPSFETTYCAVYPVDQSLVLV